MLPKLIIGLKARLKNPIPAAAPNVISVSWAGPIVDTIPP